MLSKLIILLSKDKVYLKSTLADQLGVGEEMAKLLLHDLAHRGYVENIAPSLGSGSCENCSSQCNSVKITENRSAVWMLTEKGRQAATGLYNEGD